MKKRIFPRVSARRQRAALLVAATCVLLASAMTGAAASDAASVYPEQLHGHWMPRDMGCPSPINYDSDALVVIDRDRLAHYEDANKPMKVRQVADAPQAWVIDSLLNVSGDGYDIPVTEVFVLAGSALTIVGTDIVDTYRKCE